MAARQSFLEPSHPELSMRWQCEIFNINRSSQYYKGISKPAYTSEQITRLHLVDEIYTRYPFFGTRQMSSYLNLNGHPHFKRHHARWAYKHLGLHSLAPGPHTSKPHLEHKVYPYLLRGMDICRVNQVWSTDLTYIRLHHGFVYLIAIIDWFSRYVLDWDLSINMEAEFCIDTLSNVLTTGKCEIFNTDQGSQFTSKGFTDCLKAHEIKISMDGKGRALDNIFVERLWRSVKYESVYLNDWGTVDEAYCGLREYFNFYNTQRPHQSLGGKTPHEIYHC